MDYQQIDKDPNALRVEPNLGDWQNLSRSWSWDDVRRELDLPGGMVNLAHEAIDRHAARQPDKVAMIWDGDDTVERYTFADMRRETNKVANALAGLGVKKGDRVFFFADRIPELYFACFGTLKLGAIIAPLFSAFGPDAVKERFDRAAGTIVVTTPGLLSKVN